MTSLAARKSSFERISRDWIDNKIMTILNKKELRQFGLVFSSGMILIFGLLMPWLSTNPWPTWPWAVSFCLVIISLMLPKTLKPLYSIWMKIGNILGWFNTRLILGLIYFIIFTPISLFFSLSGRDVLTRRPDASLNSYRIKSKKLDTHRMQDPF